MLIKDDSGFLVFVHKIGMLREAIIVNINLYYINTFDEFIK